MDDKERLLLLDLILQDIRGNWAFDVQERISEAFELASELELEQFIDSINEYGERCENGVDDGRFFRIDYKYGGYLGMQDVHGLSYTISNRSDEFKMRAQVLTYPDFRFTDWS